MSKLGSVKRAGNIYILNPVFGHGRWVQVADQAGLGWGSDGNLQFLGGLAIRARSHD